MFIHLCIYIYPHTYTQAHIYTYCHNRLKYLFRKNKVFVELNLYSSKTRHFDLVWLFKKILYYELSKQCSEKTPMYFLLCCVSVLTETFSLKLCNFLCHLNFNMTRASLCPRIKHKHDWLSRLCHDIDTFILWLKLLNWVFQGG